MKLVNETACIQFTAGTSAPMTVQLIAVFKVAGVELSYRFEVAQLVLQPESGQIMAAFHQSFAQLLPVSGRRNDNCRMIFL